MVIIGIITINSCMMLKIINVTSAIAPRGFFSQQEPSGKDTSVVFATDPPKKRCIIS